MKLFSEIHIKSISTMVYTIQNVHVYIVHNIHKSIDEMSSQNGALGFITKHDFEQKILRK